jgi:hypothetical protein
MDESSSERPLERARGYRHGVRSAMSELEHVLAAPQTTGVDEWVAAVAGRLERLRGAFERHVANAEGEGGLFEEVAQEVPRLIPRIDKLRADHVRLTAELTALARQLDGPPAAAAVADVRRAGIDLLAHLAHHRYRGSDLVYEAYNVDIEAAD